MKREIILDGRTVNDDSLCYVIAEVGHNHQGSVEKAKELFRKAKEAGADAVKLQKRDNQTLFTRKFYNAPYENPNSYGATYGEHREALEFGLAEHRELQQYCKELGISFFSTPFDCKSVDFLEGLGMPFYKIASADLINIPLLKHVAKTQKPIILSTGGGNFEDVKRAFDAVMPINPRLVILQCTAAYPVFDYNQMNLNVIKTFREAFPGNVIGLSDHESGINMAVIAYILGARIIEKHFTLNRALKGTDHSFSLEPKGLSNVVRNLKRARESLGSGVKKQFPNEAAPIKKMSKSIYAARNLPEGHVLTEKDLALMSPGGEGLAPYEWDRVIGKALKKSINQEEPILWDLLKL